MKISHFIPITSIAVLLATLSSCKPAPQNDLTRDQMRWVEKTLQSMTTEQKVGQLLAPAFSPPMGESDPDKIAQVTRWINKYHIGHLYITSNRLDLDGTARFLNTVQAETDIPLLVLSGLETGVGGRFDGGTILPPLMGLAQTRSDSMVYNAASITAREAKAVGIHLADSPVLDVNINSENPVICIRSFGDNPSLVSTLGKAYVKGLDHNGLLSCAKHFPGHGDVSIDSHSKMPTITASRERLDSVEFYPYSKVIPSGLRAVMTAHISIPAIDPTPGLPATLSKPILTGVLRNDLGFDGLIITDAFDMSGILERGSFEESALQSVLAGHDVVLLWRNPQFEQVFPHFVKAIEEGRLSESQLDQSVRRILIAKALAGLHQEILVDPDQIHMKVNTPEDREMAREIWEKSVVLVKNENNLLPLNAGDKNIALLSLNDDENHLNIAETFIEEVERRGHVISSFQADPLTPGKALSQAMTKAQNSDVIVVGLFARIFARRGSASLINEQLIQMLQELSQGETPVFVVSFGSPYLIDQFPEVEGYMVATEPTWDFYGYDKFRPGQIAAARALFGEVDITGKLAVSIPGLYPFGHGIAFTP